MRVKTGYLPGRVINIPTNSLADNFFVKTDLLDDASSIVGGRHKVALRADVTMAKAHDVVRMFCRDLLLAPRGHTFFHDDH